MTWMVTSGYTHPSLEKHAVDNKEFGNARAAVRFVKELKERFSSMEGTRVVYLSGVLDVHFGEGRILSFWTETEKDWV